MQGRDLAIDILSVLRPQRHNTISAKDKWEREKQ